MITPGELLRRLQRVDIDTAAQLSIEDTASDYTRAQRDQLFQGIRSDGEMIVPPYTPRTVSIKKRRGQPTDRVTLKDTSDFYRGILIDVRQDIFTVQSADEKNISLQQKYGVKIFGLSSDKQREYIANLRPVFILNLKKQIGA